MTHQNYIQQFQINKNILQHHQIIVACRQQPEKDEKGKKYSGPSLQQQHLCLKLLSL